jgi:U3 small nucleolar RNA-associated protein 18
MSAFFLGEKNVVVSGRRPFFYLYDSIAGKLSEHRITGRAEKSWEKTVPSTDGRTLALLGNDGYVILWDAQTKSVRSKNSIKLNGSVRAVTFSADQGRGTYLYASGSDGDVYIFDTRKDNQCVERFANADGTITSSLAVSPSNVLAVGAESGVVNLYNQDNTIKDNVGRDSSGQLQNLPSPIKSLLHITTSLDQLRFNDDGKILAFSSCRERDSLRLLHVESRTVFSNWPTSKTPLNYVYSTDFSPKSKFLAIGNDKGNCLLYRLNHYCTDEQ